MIRRFLSRLLQWRRKPKRVPAFTLHSPRGALLADVTIWVEPVASSGVTEIKATWVEVPCG